MKYTILLNKFRKCYSKRVFKKGLYKKYNAHKILLNLHYITFRVQGTAAMPLQTG